MMRTMKKADGASFLDFDQDVFNRKLIGGIYIIV